MKNNMIFQKVGLYNKLLLIASVVFTLSFAACSDDNNSEDPYFYVENQPTGITLSASGIKQASRKAYTIRSNRSWTINKETDAEWLHIFADEGEDDGIFDIWADANTAFTSRTANLIFKVEGQEQPVMFRVDQKADVPSVTIANAANGYTILSKGGSIKIPVSHNVKWTANLATCDWASIDSVGADTVYVTATKNTGDEARTVTLTAVGLDEYSSLSSSTVISQSPAGIIMNDTFDWLQLGEELPTYSTPEVRIDLWGAAETAHGWTSIGGLAYGGRGYVKLGKTSYGGDIVTPALSSISGTQNVKVTFKAIGYVSAGSTKKAGSKDDAVIKVVVINGGTISNQTTADFKIKDVTYKAATFVTTVFPNSKYMENGADYDPWSQADAVFTFKVTGATKDTKIIFVGGGAWDSALSTVGQGKNRIFLKDVKVVADE